MKPRSSPHGRRHPIRARAAYAAMLLAAAAVGRAGDYLGPCDLVASKDGKTLYVINADAKQVAWVELPGGTVARRVSVPARPTGLVLSGDDSKLFVTCAAPKSPVVVIDTKSGATTLTMTAGHTAGGPAITPDGKRLYVCNRFDNDVWVFDVATGRRVARVATFREPVTAAVTPDGKAVLVGDFLPHARTHELFAERVAAAITVIDTRTHETSTIRLPDGSHSLREFCFSADGKYAYVTHILSNFSLVTSQLDQGWMNINAISVIDVKERKFVKTAGLDEAFLGTGNPWGIDRTPDGKTICVGHAGAHQLSVVEPSVLMGRLEPIYMTPDARALPYQWRPGEESERRIKLPGKGPRGMVIIGTKVYVAEYFSDTLAVVDLDGKGDDRIRTIALGPKPRPDIRRRGQLLFNDATICYQNWQSCASCHPDGRTDGINWDLINDGTGNFKSTKSMILAYKTPPMMAEGVRATAEEAVRAGMTHILFATRPEEEAAAVDAYLKSLRPVPSPRLVDGRLSAAARRGKALFESNRVGCHKCHPAPLYTDLRMHDVGTKGKYEMADRYDTPTLIEVWRTAPYLHDGRYLTIQELIGDGKHGKSRGYVEELNKQQIDDLAEFVLSL